jgi:hypothetical protein
VGHEKSEIKMALAHELGASFDDALEAANRDVYRWDGAKTSLGNAAVAVEALVGLLKKEMDAEAKKGETEVDEEMFVLGRKWILRAAEVVKNLRLQAEVQEQRAHGRVEALQTSVKITKKLYDTEEQKIRAAKEQEQTPGQQPAGGPRPARTTGTRPESRVAAIKAAERAQSTG